MDAPAAEKTDHWIRMRVTLEVDVPPGPSPDAVAAAIRDAVVAVPGADRPITMRSVAVAKPFDTHFHSIDRIGNLRETDLAAVLGTPIHWTVKEDGACLGCTLTNDMLPHIHLHTRESPSAAKKVYQQFHESGRADGVADLLVDLEAGDGRAVVFGEILAKGKSPQKVQVYDRHEFVVFDILTERRGYLPYPEVAQICERYDLPVVECLGVTSHDTLESLLAKRDLFVEVMQARSREGVVGKVWRHPGDPRPIFFKEKWKAPRGASKSGVDRPEKPALPDLPEDEIRGAVEKARCEIGADFFEIKTAMPVVARYVGIEAKKHGCAVPRNVIDYYRERCESLRGA
jgi:hypothetical protein